MEITKGKIKKARKTVIHGEHGLGKTTWAARKGTAIFICTEEGSNNLDVSRLPLAKSYKDVINQIGWLAKNIEDLKASPETAFDTVVLDSVDWLEGFIESDLEAECFDQSYGKGVAEIASRVGRVLNGLDVLAGLGLSPVVIAHSSVRTIERAEGGSYSRYEPKLSKRSNARLLEWADEVAYCTLETMVVDESSGFNGTRGVGVSTGKRVLRLNPSPSWAAKNRCPEKVPASIDLSDIDTYNKLFGGE